MPPKAMGGRLPAVVVRREIQDALTEEAKDWGMTRAELMREICELRYMQKQFKRYMRAAEDR